MLASRSTPWRVRPTAVALLASLACPASAHALVAWTGPGPCASVMPQPEECASRRRNTWLDVGAAVAWSNVALALPTLAFHIPNRDRKLVVLPIIADVVALGILLPALLVASRERCIDTSYCSIQTVGVVLAGTNLMAATGWALFVRARAWPPVAVLPSASSDSVGLVLSGYW